ncbi:hypothetical protein BDR04DRAFT_1234121 [Suillus decipiens]|nr:hypothetical protein BDR04DRAFT_1234121 [Suillus decipiens]
MSAANRRTHPGRGRKKSLQRLYRLTEAEDFSQLRQIIKDITQENPNTRHDILTKAVETIKQLVADYRLLAEEHGASTPTTRTSSSPGSPMLEHPTPVHPASHFLPENLSMNYDHPMHTVSSPNITYGTMPYHNASALTNWPNSNMDYEYSYNNHYFDSQSE